MARSGIGRDLRPDSTPAGSAPGCLELSRENRDFPSAPLLWRTPAKLRWRPTRVLQEKAGETANSVGSVHGGFSVTCQLLAGLRHGEGISTPMHVNHAAVGKMREIKHVAGELHHEGQCRIGAGNFIGNVSAVLQRHDVFGLSRSDQRETGNGGNQKLLHGFNPRCLTGQSLRLSAVTRKKG